MLILSIKLFLSHILGDFLLQPYHWTKDKEKRKHKSKFMYAHVLIHLICLLVVLQFDIKYIIGILIIVISHYIIDVLKVSLMNNTNKRILFFADQALHLLVIFLVASYYSSFNFEVNMIYNPRNLLFLTAIIFCTAVASIVMKVIISRWKFKKKSKSLEKAGNYIGILERLFIFGFIVLNQWSAIGFLLAAKSVFRFGDLTKASDRKLTEYILIGTLLSFGFAIATALIYLYFADKLVQ